MSAFVVSPEHITELVAFAVTKNIYGSLNVDPRALSVTEAVLAQLTSVTEKRDIATIYAGILYSENLRSVNFRYDDVDSIEEMPGNCNKPSYIVITDTNLRNRRVTDPVAILKMCACLEYQSCETDDWEQTDAYHIIQSIKDAAIMALPGYDDAPWDYNEPIKRTSSSPPRN